MTDTRRHACYNTLFTLVLTTMGQTNALCRHALLATCTSEGGNTCLVLFRLTSTLLQFHMHTISNIKGNYVMRDSSFNVELYYIYSKIYGDICWIVFCNQLSTNAFILFRKPNTRVDDSNVQYIVAAHERNVLTTLRMYSPH